MTLYPGWSINQHTSERFHKNIAARFLPGIERRLSGCLKTQGGGVGSVKARLSGVQLSKAGKRVGCLVVTPFLCQVFSVE